MIALAHSIAWNFDSIVPEVIAVLSGDLERRIYRVVA